jgi:hypothetical protein
MTRLLTIFFLSLLTFQVSYAGNSASISGKLLQVSGDPVSYVNVILLNQDSILVKADFSREDGSFSIANLNSGTYQLKFSSVEFENHLTDLFVLNEGESKKMQPIILNNAVTELADVEVKATRPLVDVQPDKLVFNVAGSTNATGSDGLDILRKAPGITVDNNDNIMLMGKNGLRIYIDGRPSHLSGQDLVNMLRGLQAEGIDAIEIITNPPAKYEAEGNAGIINIKLKRDKNLGLQSSINLGYNRGYNDNYRGSFDFNYRSQKLNLFGNYNYSDHRGFNNEDLDRVQNGNFLHTDSKLNWNYKGNHFRTGMDYYLDKKNTIGILVNGSINSLDMDNKGKTPFGSVADGQIDQILFAGGDRKNPRTNINTNFNYTFNGEDGSKISFDADYGYFHKDASGDMFNYYKDPSGQEILSSKFFRDSQLTDIDIWTIKADYERKIGEGNLSTGFKFSNVSTENAFDFYQIVDGEDVMDLNRSNDFNYTERIDAAYASYMMKVSEKVSINGGIRIEHTFSEGILKGENANNDNTVERSYTNLFPSGGFSWQASPKNKLSLNFSRRIDRPNYEKLNPFEFKLDEITYRRGNPFLNPQYTNNFQLSHSFNQKINTQLSYSKTQDYFAQITYAIDERSSMITEENIADATNIGLSVNYNTDITKWWNVFNNINVYRAKYSSDQGEFTLNMDRTTLNVYLKNSFLLPGDVSMELSGWYNSPSVWGGTFRMQSMYSVDLGFKKTMMDKRATLSVSFSDLFYSTQYIGSIDFGGIDMRIHGRNDSRQVRIGFSYRLGNQQVKASRRRSTGLEEEQKRLESGQ